ncbi:MAG: M20/M25/M40 family metallo-hydrolase [Pirellula sp.]|jgi:acetylornithine deacetylase|nr:M20/M25/M40 family metallo-hydrolase [Pirellula sp.]
MSQRLSRAIELTQQMVSFPSVSDRSNVEVSQFVAARLAEIGFDVEWLTYEDEEKVPKVCVVAKRGAGLGGVAYLAHTDVVPAEDWEPDFSGAFEGYQKDGRLYGRGTCDMKGSLAAALTAAANVHNDQPLYFVVTSDEEVGMRGASFVNQHSKLFEEMVTHDTMGIVGEPTELQVIHAHKGAESFAIVAKGVSAHTSTNGGVNANYKLIPALSRFLELRNRAETDPQYHDKSFDPPTLSWNMTISNEPEAVNVTTSMAILNNFFRAMPAVDHEPLLSEVRRIAEQFGLECRTKYSARPWSVDPQSDFVGKMLELTGQQRSYSVCYATDAGVLQRLRRMVICGPGSIEQAHRCDEWISLDQLSRGVELYERAFMTRW